jgi:3-methyl-2-oxobutanoate hydroxymethyltransferase
MMAGKVRITTIQKMKQDGQKVAMLTAYDYPTARILDMAGIDIILVGDSVGSVALGYPNTVPVTMAEMIHHCQAVRRGVTNSLLVGDMPFMSYKISREQALTNATRLVQRGGAEAVKMEGGGEIVSIINAVVQAGIPVMGHVGLTPQSIHQLGGYRIQGRDDETARRLLDDAKRLEEAGVFALVIEAVPEEVGKTITEALRIPTIGIGAGRWCDGQVLVLGDFLGLTFGKIPRFAKQYADLQQTIRTAVEEYIRDVREGRFPDETHHY